MDNFFADYPVEGGGSGSGVSSLNGLTGALTLVAGSGITITPSGSNITIAATGVSSVPLSSLTSAVAANTIDNSNNAQVWSWNSLNTETALTLSSNSMSSGHLLQLSTTSSSLTSSLLDLTVSTANPAGKAISINMSAGSGNPSAILVNQVTGTALDVQNVGANGIIPAIKLANYNPMSGAANGDGVQINFAANNSGGGHVDIGYITGYMSDITTSAGVLSVNTPNVAALSNDILVNTGDTSDPGGLSGNIILRPGTGATASSNSGSILLATQSVAGASGIAGDILLVAGSGNAHSGNIVLRLTNDEGPFGSLKIKDGSEGTAGYVWTSTDTAGSGTWLPVPGSSPSPVRIVTGTDTLSATTDNKIICNAGAGSFNLNLPAGTTGLSFVLVNAAANSGSFTIVPNGGDVLDTNIQAIFNANEPVPITFISGSWYAV